MDVEAAREALKTIRTQLNYLEEGFESLPLGERRARIAEMRPLIQRKQQILNQHPRLE